MRLQGMHQGYLQLFQDGESHCEVTVDTVEEVVGLPAARRHWQPSQCKHGSCTGGFPEIGDAVAQQVKRKAGWIEQEPAW